ncbi:MAG: hypothetical protein JST58_02260 [Bacteroidetes bacterium]|nr:hypothetical protein [Bacteroidota bacterium]
MEQNTNISNLFDLQIDQQTNSYLGETAKWTKFLSILGFIFCGIFVIVGIFFGSVIGALFSGKLPGAEMSSAPGAGGFGALFAIIYILLALLYFFPCFYLYNFSSKMQIALRNNDQSQLNNSFKNLKSCFKFLGILTIVILSFYVLAIIFSIIAGAAFR